MAHTTRRTSESSPLGEPQLREITERLPVGAVLDIGCGEGTVSGELLAAFPRLQELHAVDVLPGELEEARRRLTDPRIQLRRADARDLPFSDDRFDAVLLSNTLHHPRNRARVASEVRRVLRPEGTFILNEVLRDGLNAPEWSLAELHSIKSAVDRALGLPHEETMSERGIDAWLVLLRTTQHVRLRRTFPVDSDSALEERIEFLSGYVGMVADKPERYARLRRRMSKWMMHVARYGTARPPELLAVCSLS